MPKKRRKALMIHTVGIFVLLIIWLLLLVFKNSLGNFKFPLFILMLVITTIAIYLLSKILLKGLRND